MGIKCYYNKQIKKWIAYSLVSPDYVSFGLTEEEALHNYQKEYMYD